jgi:hypothetical protein
MNNPIYNQINGGNQELLRKFNQFRQGISGDPREQVQRLLNSGRVTQDQYNNAVRIAEQLRRIINI